MFDIASLRPVPNLTLASPMDECELRRLMYTAQLPGKGTFVMRYPRGRGVRTGWHCDFAEIEIGKGRMISDGNDIAVLSYGPVGNDVQKAIVELRDEGFAASVAHYDLRFAKPLDTELLEEVASRFACVITIEDGMRAGGVGTAVLEWMSDNRCTAEIVRMGLPDRFIEHGTVDELHRIAGIDTESIKRTVKECVARARQEKQP